MKAIIRKSFPQRLLPILLSASVLLLTLFPAGAIIDVTLQMQLGNPTGATADTNNHDHYLIQRPVETIDYSDNLGQPNWASWDLTATDVGSSGRSPNFFPDTNLPSNFNLIPSNTYGSIGGQSYDRGHMCPSADRTTNTTYNDMVFIMSNIIPQASAQNQGVWAQLENDCRTNLSSAELLIMCGPYNFGTNRLDSGLVGVASNTWKIVVLVPLGSGTAFSRITNANPNSIRVIAVEIPNIDAAGSSHWSTFLTSAKQIQNDTGYNFFSALPNNLAWVLRSKVDSQASPVPGSISFSPASGPPGAAVTLTGTNLDTVTNVTFNGTVASYTITSPTQITATVPAAATTGTITVHGLGGNATTSSSFTAGGAAVVDLAVTSTHAGSFTQGDTSHTYTLIITNKGNAASSGTITVADTLPTGLTATAISGAGWTTNLGTLTCTRSDALVAGAAYPPITVSVSVSASAPANVTNTVSVSGSGDTNLANNTASDPTTVNAAAAPTAVTGTPSAIGTTNTTLNGTVNPNGQPATVQFQYGTNLSYGSVASVSGTITGSTAQAVSASLTGLLSGTTYHFRVTATNVLGSSTGLDQTFNTEVPGIADLAVTVTHASNFTQGDPNDTYTIIVTNAGAAASSGAVTVVDTLPTGLTATAISGTGWSADLGTLTCTRANALASGAAYPAITVSVSVSASAPVSVTNIATVSGGGDLSQANNTASDPTTVNTATAPTVATSPASAVGTTAATLNGTVNPNSQTATVHFDYGLTTNYGSTASVSGTFTGATVQAVSANITGLAASTLYHFRVAAINVLGSTSGLNQTFTTTATPLPDLAITVTHSGNFTQGDTGDTYTIMVTNVGAGASSGTVTITNSLPAGLTATAISGGGWTTNLGNLTCTRSNSLAAGASYPSITVTVNVATNAPASVIFTAILSGGGDTNLANNTASDPTTINPSRVDGGVVTLVGWDMHGLSGGTDNFGPSPLSPTTNAANLTIVAGLTRGTGVGTTGSGAARGWGGNTFTETTSAAAIATNRFVTFAVAAHSGYKVSYTSISRFDYRHSGTGPPNGLLQYQIGSGAFADIAAFSYPSNTSSGGSLSPIDLSGISALQGVGAGTNITFRIVNWGGTSSAGTWYIFDVANTNTLDFAIEGLVSPVVAPTADLTISASHTGTFTQGDIGDTYTVTVTNIGAAATAGSVSVVDTLPAGLAATALSGNGWTANLTNLTCTRSDALPAGSNYPPITVTVNVFAGALASVTNVATVSGGGDVSSINNTASDPTTILAAAAPTATTGMATALGTTTASLNGTVNPNGQPATVQFQYGTDTNYGSVASVSGTIIGSSAQAVSASLTGLLSGMTYHFRVTATNLLGASTGLDQTFSTAVPEIADLAITAAHAGNFTQGDGGDTYTIIVTNLGNAPSSGTITVVDTLPTGLTATAISGAGWATNLGTLTCTRADALAVGAAYPPITVTVSVAADAAASVTNAATVSSGGDVSPANNTASDPTTILAAAAPTAITGSASGVSTNTAILNGEVNPNGQSATVQFQYGLTPSYGSTLPVSGSLSGATLQAVSASLPGLLPGTTYHFRVAATNVLGANAGQDQVFTTLTPIEAWRLQWFGTTTNSNAAADTAIATSDGMPNLLKYALGLNPLVATNDPVAGDISTGYLRLTVPKNAQATDVTFHVELTSDVTTVSWTTNGTTVDLDTATLLQVHANTPVASSDGAFIRLRVTRP